MSIQFAGVDTDGDHVFSVPPTNVLIFDECGGTKGKAVWCFVQPNGQIACEGAWYQPQIVYRTPAIGSDLHAMILAVQEWIIDCEERYP